MKHKVIKIENLMYKGCETHYGCVICSACVPVHCYKREDFEQMECTGLSKLTFPVPKDKNTWVKNERKIAKQTT